MNFAIVIVAWNGRHYLSDCLGSVLAQRLTPRSILVVDNASVDDSAGAAMQYFEHARQLGTELALLRLPTNLGFTCGANVGLRTLLSAESRPDVVVLLNQDATLDPSWCESAAAILREDSRIAVIGSKIFYPNRLTIQHAGGYLERPRLVGRHHGHHDSDSGALSALREVEFVTAAAMGLRLAALREVGVFDEIFSPGYYEDVELCERIAAAGWRIVYCPQAIATHVESASFVNRALRLSLSHRNRFVYALASLADPEFRTKFLEAEKQFLAGGLLPDERRALASACLSILLALPMYAAARIPAPLRAPELLDDLIKTFAELRETALTATLNTSMVISPRHVQPR